MPRICTVCAHSSRAEIDAALLTTETKRGIARRYAIDEDAVSRHAANHLATELREAADLAEASRLDILVADVQRLRCQADRLGKAAEEQGDPRTALAALRESRETMAFLAKLLGLGARDTIDLQVSEVHRFEPTPDFLAKVAQNLRELHLPEPDTRIMLDMRAAGPSPPATNGHDDVKPVPTSADLAEESDIDEYDAETHEVRPHHATPPPSGLGVIKLRGSNPDRWNWER